MPTPKKKVLIIEDSPELQNDFAQKLSGKVKVLQALTLPQAEEIFSKNPDIDLIASDGLVPVEIPPTIELIKKIRQTYTGPIIAMSSTPKLREELMQAGCSHNCARKKELPRMILKILGLSNTA